jgi:hypothetical protein
VFGSTGTCGRKRPLAQRLTGGMETPPWSRIMKTLAVLLAFAIASAACLSTTDANARPLRHGYVNGHPIVCGRGTIPVRMYAAAHYFARPSVCGGALVTNNLNPDFQLGGRR